MSTHLLTRDQGRPGLSAADEPVLRVAAGAGDRISFETDDAAYAQMEELRDLSKITAPLNPVTGPVFVEGAEPGDALAVTIHDITFGDVGWSVYIPGAGALAGPMGEEWFVRRIPLRDGRAQLTERLDCAVAPMAGCVMVAPADGELSTVMPSYPTGGNMDLTDAAPGSTVYLPVQVPGALLSLGDLHAVMSRGESSFVAIEAAGRVTVSVDVVKGLGSRMRAPRVDTGRELVCVGLGDPVQDSIDMAYESLFSVLVDERGVSREDAYVVMSALAHTELGGPTGSVAPDPLHPFRPVGAVTLARIAREVLDTL
ncbi:acetamidase/formamidase family protein [Phycicoccus sp. Soil748]|uniref:acetamidase/formamidase family protein n=1 Tax=Phycicoccus sp. Soil748 TaxID=1736397 RepID=UPI000703AACB|nr:acetamidase/formamidase family protein [Phycicoccus sp. Soil748]KRE58944.1 acetamidase/formamidase [Phycicoccus sp. Soil748]